MAHQFDVNDEERLNALLAINREAIRQLQADVKHYAKLSELMALKGKESLPILNTESPHPPVAPEPPASG